jgi:hypothetical protein
MKIDKSKLTQIIKEEIENATNVRVATDSTEDPVEEGLGRTIVDGIVRYFTRIKNGKLYAQLLKAVLDLPLKQKVSELNKSLQLVADGDQALYRILVRRFREGSQGEGEMGAGAEVEAQPEAGEVPADNENI